MNDLPRNPSLRLSPRGIRLACAAAGICTLASIACRAEDAGAADPRALLKLSVDELLNVRVTTVAREESTIGHSAAAVTVITQEDIRRSGATTIPELFRRVPGIHVARIDGNKWAIASRGFNSRFAKNLLVLVDGRTVYSPQTAGVFWDGVDCPLQDIDRIEVIRGPGASAWGANAVNGIINIVTKPTRDTLGGLISGGGGTEERGFGTIRYGGKIGDTISYRVFGKGFDRGKQFSLEGDTNDQWWSANGGLRVEWTPNRSDTITFDGGYGRSITGTNDRFALASGPPYAVNVPEEDTTEFGHVMAVWRREVSQDSGWKLQAYWDRWSRTARTISATRASTRTTWTSSITSRSARGRKSSGASATAMWMRACTTARTTAASRSRGSTTIRAWRFSAPSRRMRSRSCRIVFR